MGRKEKGGKREEKRVGKGEGGEKISEEIEDCETKGEKGRGKRREKR